MAEEINEFQHSNFVWTWKSNAASHRVSLWLPYLSRVEKIKGSSYRFIYNGGEVDADLGQVDFIMLYGASGSLEVGFLDALNQHRICLFIHRRNQLRPYMFLPASGNDDRDVLTPQIRFRCDAKKSAYIARTLIRERFRSMEQRIPVPGSVYRQLAATRNVDEVRTLEAQVTKRYWDAYYTSLGLDVARREEHPINAALDAGSMFLFGIILRWVLFHKLSPSHGYLHLPTGYPSLCYDLIEPFRYVFEEAVADSWRAEIDEKALTAATFESIKRRLEVAVYVPSTRQTVRLKNLLHGVVLALRAYLVGESKRLVLPVAGLRQGGRPPKVSYRLPGSLSAKA